jgi:hypothetical protein
VAACQRAAEVVRAKPTALRAQTESRTSWCVCHNPFRDPGSGWPASCSRVSGRSEGTGPAQLPQLRSRWALALTGCWCRCWPERADDRQCSSDSGSGRSRFPPGHQQVNLTRDANLACTGSACCAWLESHPRPGRRQRSPAARLHGMEGPGEPVDMEQPSTLDTSDEGTAAGAEQARAHPAPPPHQATQTPARKLHVASMPAKLQPRGRMRCLHPQARPRPPPAVRRRGGQCRRGRRSSRGA